ncbi:acidic repeat-containing protein-like [Pollicipes pollicipes]|uniref:acidic repeat-containing protein-like n=1 Tax=Pollicipes pollicipes TaxID=41117 RepID=UPI0018851632|nr:acidic repeat-containing protein-like [Pollicipes pollicipes]
MSERQRHGYWLRERKQTDVSIYGTTDGSSSEEDDRLADPDYVPEPYLDSDESDCWSEGSESSDEGCRASVGDELSGDDRGEASAGASPPAGEGGHRRCRPPAKGALQVKGTTDVKKSGDDERFVKSRVQTIASDKPGQKHAGRVQSDTLNFMTSLAADLPKDQRRDAEAEGFVHEFGRKKINLAKRLFCLINTEVFGSQLPDDFEIKFNNRMLRSAGFCYCKQTACGDATVRTARIELSEKVVDSAERLRDTLVHELCHAVAWVVSGDRGGHGPVWRGWAGRVQRRFPELPPVSRCHSYEVHCKYTYRCTRCGYSFGRHSKSLDTQRKVCGRCHGRFECVLTAALERQAGAAPATPRTPEAKGVRSPLGKNNCSSAEQDAARLKSSEDMQLLGQQFAATKIGPHKPRSWH